MDFVAEGSRERAACRAGRTSGLSACNRWVSEWEVQATIYSRVTTRWCCCWCYIIRRWRWWWWWWWVVWWWRWRKRQLVSLAECGEPIGVVGCNTNIQQRTPSVSVPTPGTQKTPRNHLAYLPVSYYCLSWLVAVRSSRARFRSGGIYILREERKQEKRRSVGRGCHSCRLRF